MDEDAEPVRLEEDPATSDRFLVYAAGGGHRLDIRFEGETLWMTQAQIAELFGRDVGSISRHIAKVLEEGELDETSLQKMQRSHGRPATLYNLDMVISVGYRVSSRQATLFRRWATGILVQYARKGFVVDRTRLKAPEAADRIAELREIIRDIRADEANVYRELRRICSMCRDYEGKAEAAQAFYRQTQAKLVYAVVSQTPSEIVHERADHRRESMGLQSWPNENIRKADVAVSKNYLTEAEARELNRLTTILLDIFEDQLDLGRIVVMEDARKLLDRQLGDLGRPLLRSGGSVSAEQARDKAQREHDLWKRAETLRRQDEADRAIAELAQEAKRPSRR